MAQVISDWLCVCASGKAIDGRNIEKSWLEDSAKNYNREKYTAMIWPYHDETPYRQFTPNLGTVDSLKYEEENGIGKLYARLVPNEFLIETNRQEQKMFTSAEFWPNFAESGDIYFSGIVVTDIPASLYTEKLKFSANNPNDPVRGEPLTFTLGKTQPYKADHPSFIQKLFGGFSFTSNQQNEQAEQPKSKENDTMTEELKALLEKLLEKLSTIEDKADGTTADTTQEAADDIADAAEEIAAAAEEVQEIAEEIAANPDDEVLKEEFTVAKAHLERLAMRFTGQEPSRRSRRGRRQFTARRSRREKSPSKKNDGDVMQLTAQLSGVLEKFTALGNRQTPKPNGAPGGEKETTVA